ncbi:hypothetical protein [Leisingera sp. JC1]|uniref:hypothetical protein n=1 Tax=Leisingera sp. JC1 TaxID=1855282 RepID=UPI0008030A18|nr:hypothetical protein [Leisingera sp. JC1]OBY24822.1 hypothetical protein A9D60_23655 [Leisingera sp. JC1]
MRIETKGKARISHAITEQEYEIEADELEWEVFGGGGERGMGQETLYRAHVLHPELGDLEWTLSEYPAGMENNVTHDVGQHKLLDDFYISFEHDEEIDPDDLEGASEDIKEWFLKHYDDPANLLPYETASGGYQWIYGGPVSAIEALSDNFGNEYPDWFLERVAKEIEAGSGQILDWSPKPGQELDHELPEGSEGAFDGDSGRLAGKLQGEAAKVLDLLEPLVEIEQQFLPLDQGGLAGIGHNGPPSPLEDLGFDRDFFTNLSGFTRRLSDNVNALEGTLEKRAELDAFLFLKDREESAANTAALQAQTAALEANTEAIKERNELLKAIIPSKKELGAGAVAIYVGDKVLGSALGKIGDKLGEKIIVGAGDHGPAFLSYLKVLTGAIADMLTTAGQYLGSLPMIF